MKLKRLACAMLAVVMVGGNIFNGFLPTVAIEGDGPTVMNDPNGPKVLSDGVVLHKTARAVPGYANEWEVTLKIEAPVVTATSDTVIVIDRSNSMNGSPLTEAKSAAETLVDELLNENNIISGNPINRVAVVSYGSNFSNESNGFTGLHDVAYNAIDEIDEGGGGTFTQGGLHMAIDLLNSSSATYKNIILLSDGEPTYSFRINNPDDYLIDGGSNSSVFDGWIKKQTSTEVSASDFVYTGYNSNRRVGDGTSMWTYYDYDYGYGPQSNWVHFYNHGNSAIAEAGFFNGKGTLYTIAFDAGETGEEVLSNMAAAAGGEAHEATAGELEGIFRQIAGKISSVVNSAHVHDVMGEGVYVDNSTHDGTLDWDPVFTLNAETGMYEATKTYRVSATEEMLEDSAHETEEGFHRLNKSATITYGDNDPAEFPVPYVKPFFVNVKKEVSGQECEEDECEFDFEIEHIATDHIHYDNSVKDGETHRIVEKFPVGDYVLTEIGETAGSGNPVAFENYTTTYTGNQFTINEEHADHIDVVIKNTYETIDLSASKVWDDGDDRDRLRDDYDDLYVVVKDGDTYVAMAELDSVNKDYEFEGLPKNRNGAEITYTIAEAKGCAEANNVITCESEFIEDDDYASTVEQDEDTGVYTITNTHEPAKTYLTIKKKWDTSAGTLPTVTPGFVTVEVSNDKNSTIETVTLQGEAYDEWTGEFEGYTYEDGEVITYTVTEKEIGTGGTLNSNNTLYVYENDVLEGKWVATRSGAEITNTWTPASVVYTGAGKFYIEKLDQDGEALSGVTFTVGEEEYTTGDDGKVEVEFSASADEPEDEYTFEITETDAPDYYDLIDGTEILNATVEMEVTSDEESLTNTYTKTFSFEVGTAVDGYVWQADDLTLTATDQALADELVIEKTFEGISATAFEANSQIKFTISGPDGFEEMTVGNGDDECEISDSTLVCTISGEDVLLPIGEYTVTESDAEIENFTYTSNPTSGEVTKTVALGEVAEFEFENIYESVKTESFKVKKVWEDDSDRDGIRPDTLEVTLLADGEAYGDPVDLEGEDWEYEWTELPLVNEDAEVIEWSASEEDLGDDYESDEGEMKDGVFTFTNTHTPETKKITIKKVWDTAAGSLPTSNPQIITVILSNDKDDETQTITLTGNDYGEWESEEIEVLVYANQGETITYSVSETEIDGSGLSGEEEDTYYVYNGEVLEGKWVAAGDGLEVTNTWTPASTVYTGAGKFYIEKLDQDGEALSGVTFTVGDEEYTTGDDGKVEVEFSASADEPEDEYTFEITETDAPDYYNLIDGAEVLGVTTTMELAVDTENLTNTYTKSFTYEVKTAVEGYAWRVDDLTLTVTDQALADELVIEKTFEGISATAFEANSQIKFTISGPDGFEEMTVGNGDDECEISDSTLVCTISGEDVLLPVGEYTVTESDAEIENFTYTSNPTSGEVTKTVELGKKVEFEFENIYESVKTESFKVKKIWEDDTDRDGIRPDTLEVTLLADGEAYGDPVKLTGDEWDYEWNELPLVNEDAEVIEWSASEEDLGDDYESDGGEMKDGVFTFTNTHEPETKKITIKKTWDVSSGNLPTSMPAFIMVELSCDDEDAETQTIRLDGDGYGEWESEEIEVLVYMNQGETITYQVRELEIDGNVLSDDEDTVYIYDGELLEGKWVVETDGLTVTNTWTPATTEYEVEDVSYFIKKVNEDGEALEGVKFEMGDEEYITDEEGKIEIEVPVTTDQPEDEFEYIISEKETLNGYDMVDGTATIMVICTSEFVEPDEENLVNKYVKTCEFEKSGEEAFVWDEEAKTLTLTNVRTYVPPVDPCAEGGCGGDTTPSDAPNTGRVAVKAGDGVVALWTNNAIGGAMMVLIGVSLLVLGKRKEVELTK